MMKSAFSPISAAAEQRQGGGARGARQRRFEPTVLERHVRAGQPAASLLRDATLGLPLARARSMA
jgi:hypothetical protein